MDFSFLQRTITMPTIDLVAIQQATETFMKKRENILTKMSNERMFVGEQRSRLAEQYR
jgi:hypothetical protein